jgi:2-polyprenyl-3-methyl-5-hydroxy-6-metoxy-1,4-benzoquinol methylase
MPIGPAVRRLMGPQLERHVSAAYRGLYVDLDDLARTIGRLGPFASIAEVGCGEGAITTRLAAAFPDARIVGIDIVPNPGCNFDGDRERVTFESMEVASLSERDAHAFELVVVCDVLHHVPESERLEFVRACHRLVAPRGLMLVKEWEHRRNFFGALAFVSDRFVSGDRDVHFLKRDELVNTLTQACSEPIVLELRVPPRRNNLLIGLRAG